jgi:mRNA interferase RelE/StbE
MALYKVEIKKSAFKELRSLNKKVIPNVWRHIKKLSKNPRPAGSVKLWSSKSNYRIRIGDYRVIYQIDDLPKTVTVYRIKHRKEAYR